MKVALFSHDTGPADNLAMVILELIKNGHYITQATLGGLSVGNLLEPRPDCIVTNMASQKVSNQQNDFPLLQQALSACPPIPMVYLADTFTACVRPAFAGKNLSQATAIVAGKKEIEQAMIFGYKEAVFLGGLPVWQTWHSVQQANIQHKVNEKIVVVGGTKNGVDTNFVLSNTVNALNQLDIPYQLIFRQHRREDPATIDKNERDSILSQCQWKTLTEVSTESVIAVADLGIFVGGTTVMVIAAYARTPAICLRSDKLDRHNIEQIGSKNFYPVMAGAVTSADIDSLAVNIANLLGDGARELRQKQAKVFPAPELGMPPGKQIVRFLEKKFS